MPQTWIYFSSLFTSYFHSSLLKIHLFSLNTFDEARQQKVGNLRRILFLIIPPFNLKFTKYCVIIVFLWSIYTIDMIDRKKLSNVDITLEIERYNFLYSNFILLNAMYDDIIFCYWIWYLQYTLRHNKISSILFW